MYIVKKILNCLLLVLALVLCASVAYAAEETTHSHCACGGGTFENHTCEEEAVYVPLDDTCFVTYKYNNDTGAEKSITKSLPSGSYYLSADFSVSGSIYIVPGEKVNLCFNGYKLTTTGRSLIIQGELNICDCGGTGGIHSKSTGNAPTLYTGSGGMVNVFGGTYTTVASSTREFGGCFGLSADLVVQDCDLDDDGTLDNKTKIPASAYIYGGKFVGSNLNCSDGSPSVYGTGACGFVSGSTTLTVYGGEFIGARAVLPEDGGTGGGGVIGNAGGTAYIYGGKFSGSTDSQGAIRDMVARFEATTSQWNIDGIK